jgi:hypothetical protein
VTKITIDTGDDETQRLWSAVGELVERLPGAWVLIGGLMVQLHAIERGATDVRPTQDIDVLGQGRPQGTLQSIDAALRDDGFELTDPDLDGYGYRYERDGVVVDVLAPDGIKPPPSLGGGVTAIGVPGGSQALSRSETVEVTVEGRSFALNRPTLLGALLIKARSLMVHADPDSQREDVLRLLALIEDPRETAVELRKSERRWLRDAEQRLDFASPSLLERDIQARAELAFRLLLRE